LPTAWWPYDFPDFPDKNGSGSEITPGGILVRWINAESEQDVLRSLEDVPSEIWTAEQFSLSIGSAPLYLFDSAYSGAELDAADPLLIRLPSGDYSVFTARHTPDEETDLILHRLTLLPLSA
jgi:hypothetical protein